MSYLSPLRLHFAGKFQAAVSTVNNDPTHFDNSAFKPEFQQRQTTKEAPNGWWNPQGDASWRLLECKVTSAWISSGGAVHGSDPVLGLLVSDSDRQVSAKLVDLDPMQQLVSEVWGMQVRLCRPDGTTLMRGDFATAAFFDIWDRAASGHGDIGACAAYQSVLTDVEWGDIADSPFLVALRDGTSAGMLSIKFNVDGYNMSFGTPDFTKGRIVGTIGPHEANAPRHFVLGRHLMAREAADGNFFTPQGKINFCSAVVDAASRQILLDLGNALPTTTAGGTPADLGTLQVGCVVTDAGGGRKLLPLGNVAYLQPDWYTTTAGVVTIPPDRALTPQELSALASSPLCLTLSQGGGTPALAIAEDVRGLYVRADRFVYRMSPGEQVGIPIHATRFGQPYAGATVLCPADTSQLQGGNLGLPAEAIAMGSGGRLKTGADGWAELSITASNPGTPRDYIDGQLFGIRPVLEDTLSAGANYPFNKWEYVSILLWSDIPSQTPWTWFGGLDQIMQQYANLYPVMSRFLDLADYDSVCANRDLLALAFRLPPENPNSMPATRDLSPAKRTAILNWLATLGPDGKPLRGTAPPAGTVHQAAATLSVSSTAPSTTPLPDRGGKAAAMARQACTRTRPLQTGETF